MIDYLVLLIFAIGVLGFIWLYAWRCRHEQKGCRHDVQSRPRWTQDGWVTVCFVCRQWIYRGDDYDAGPE